MKYLACLDAGHGIGTSGKRSPDETLREFEFNRALVSLVDYHLQRHDVGTILTAPTDSDISLTRRVNIANSAKVDIFASFHANAAGEKGWYMAEDGLQWNTANGWEIYYSEGSEKGKRLAEAIHAESIPYLGIRDRGILTTTGLTVVRKPYAPSILIEHGFYTNEQEVELLKSDAFRGKCAIADAKGILRYFGIKWQEPKEEIDYKPLYESALAQSKEFKALYESEKATVDGIKAFLA